MKIFLIFVFICAFYSSKARSINYNEIKDIEKIAISLTGKPLSEQQIKSFVDGKTDRTQIIEILSKSDDFVDHFAKFWSERLGISSVFNLANIIQLGTKSRLVDLITDNPDDYRRLDPLISRDTERDNPAERYELDRKTIEKFEITNAKAENFKGSIRLNFQECGKNVLITSAYLPKGHYSNTKLVIARGTYRDKTPISLPKISQFPSLSGTALYNARLKYAKDVYQKSLDLTDMINPSCEQMKSLAIQVKPYWDPSIKNFWAAKWILDPQRCGSDLSGCYSTQPYFPLNQELGKATSLEPGRIIGKTVADDKDFKTILTTSKTVLTGHFAYFLKTKMTKSIWRDNFPTDKYVETSPEFISPDRNSNKMFWADRGPAYSGVLSTFTYQTLTNGRRAKANKAFEAFTCSKFTVPEGAVPDPNNDNPDLRKRPYCAYCHRSLEPMAAFFNRWPATGIVNYQYDKDKNIDARGLFRGQTGTGVKDFGALMAASTSFASCAIQRAFEFLHGREMSNSESNVLLSKYLKIYNENDSNLRLAMKAMIESSQFIAE